MSTNDQTGQASLQNLKESRESMKVVIKAQCLDSDLFNAVSAFAHSRRETLTRTKPATRLYQHHVVAKLPIKDTRQDSHRSHSRARKSRPQDSWSKERRGSLQCHSLRWLVDIDTADQRDSHRCPERRRLSVPSPSTLQRKRLRLRDASFLLLQEVI